MSDAGARLVASAFGAIIAEAITLPCDVVKTRLQVQQVKPYRNPIDCLLRTAREEGPSALWKGLAPALVRQVCYTSFTFVLYEPVRNFYAGLFQDGSSPNFAQRLLAGGTSGALAISVFNPTEVLKTQMQTSSSGLPMREVVMRVWARDGLPGFWAGLQPNLMRTFLVNAAELGTYDEAKVRIQPYLGPGLASHVSASGIAGFASACVSTPADVVKTRLMNSAGRERAYTGIIDAGTSILRDEGITALYGGFVPILCRKVLWCTCFFVTFERARETARVKLGY